ncbi:MAG TPA: hypothetical protein VFK80_00425, partial [Limnochordia bacterium]|nr:hypothetical protein [Limnochordia bacterium]
SPAKGGASMSVFDDPSFFPIGVWLQSPGNAAGYRAMGVNTFVAQWNALNDQSMAQLTAAGMNVITDQGRDFAYAGEPRLIAWMHQDEPDNAQADGKGGWGPPVSPAKLLADYQAMKAKDPSRPVFLGLGQGVAWPEYYGRGVDAGRTDVYYRYAEAGDILRFDIYPVNSPDAPVHGKLWLVAQGVDNLRKYGHDAKPVWAVIETTNIDGREAAHTPTPHQVKAEVWMALVHGAKGISYFCHIFKPRFDEPGLLHDDVMRPAVSAINRQITELAPVLNSATITGDAAVASSNAAVPIDVMEKRYGGATYLFAVGMRDGATTGRFTVPSLAASGAANVEVIGEGRSLRLVNGAFGDAFEPYGVHLYKIGG